VRFYHTKHKEATQVESITVSIGRIQSTSGGIVQDNTREVQFQGEELATRTEFGAGREGGIADTRGVTETLYKAADGKMVAHIEDWSHWEGEPTIYSLHAVTEADLGPNGRFEALGAEAGFGRPLTLDEALVTPEEED